MMIDGVVDKSSQKERYNPAKQNPKDKNIDNSIISLIFVVNFSATNGGILKRAITSISPTDLMLITTVRAIKIIKKV